MLWRYPNVIGTAVGFRQRAGKYTDEVAIQVYVSRKLAKRSLRYPEIIPPSFWGPDGEAIPTDVIEAGSFRPTNGQYRPVEGGCSIGPIGVGVGDKAGTLGGFAWDTTDQSVVMLTCNHVLTTDDTTTLPSDTSILQPAMPDGGIEPQDTIGQSKRIVPIAVSPNSPYPESAVDCGVATITATWDPNIIDMGGGIFLTAVPELGMPVQKRGSSTGLTTNGVISATDGQFVVQYEQFPTAYASIGIGNSVFQVMAPDGNPFAADGDSGALIATLTENADVEGFPIVGMHFMSNDPNTPTLWGACAIQSVFQYLGLTTLCTGSVDSIIAGAAISLEATGKPTGSHMAVARKAEQLRRLRDQVLPTTPGGRALLEFVRRHAPRLASEVLRDETAHGLAVRAMAPWFAHPSNFEMLQAEIDAGTVRCFGELIKHLGGNTPEIAVVLNGLQTLLAEFEGKTLAELLGGSALPI